MDRQQQPFPGARTVDDAGDRDGTIPDVQPELRADATFRKSVRPFARPEVYLADRRRSRLGGVVLLPVALAVLLVPQAESVVMVRDRLERTPQHANVQRARHLDDERLVVVV